MSKRFRKTNKMKGLNKKEKAQVRRIAKGVSETKHIDQTQIYSSGTLERYDLQTNISHLTPIAQGDSEHQRVGVQVDLKRLMLRLYIVNSPASTPAQLDDVVRYTLFWWNDDLEPVADDLYLTGAHITSPLRTDFVNERRGFVIQDRLVNLTSGSNSRVKVINIKLNRKARYVGALAGNVSKGQLYFAFGGTDDGTAHPGTSAVVYSRVFYKDP